MATNPPIDDLTELSLQQQNQQKLDQEGPTNSAPTVPDTPATPQELANVHQGEHVGERSRINEEVLQKISGATELERLDVQSNAAAGASLEDNANIELSASDVKLGGIEELVPQQVEQEDATKPAVTNENTGTESSVASNTNDSVQGGDASSQQQATASALTPNFFADPELDVLPLDLDAVDEPVETAEELITLESSSELSESILDSLLPTETFASELPNTNNPAVDLVKPVSAETTARLLDIREQLKPISEVPQAIVNSQSNDDAPIVEAGEGSVVQVGDVVTITGSGSDPEGESLSYAWEQLSGPEVTLEQADTASPQFTVPDLSSVEQVVFQLTVSDGVNSSTDTVSFTVDGRPVVTANAGEDVQIEEGNSVTLQGGGATNTGGELTYAWKQVSGPEVTLNDASSASPGFSVPELLSDSAIEFELTVSDGTTSSTDTVVVNIAADNDAPIVEAGEGSVVQVGDVVTITGSGNDPEGESLSYAWEQLSGPEVTLEQADTASPQFTVPDLPSVEQVVFQLTVSDGVNSSTDTVSFTVDGRPVVTANAGEDVQIEEGNSVTLQGGGATNTGGELTYAWKQLSGPEVTLSDASSASPGFSVPELLSDSAIEFELTVSDGTTSSTDTVVVNIAADNDAPIVEAGEGSVVQVGDVVTITGSGSDPEGESLSYAWEQLSGPEVTLEQADTASPQFTVPDLPSVEQVVFQLTVSDGVNSSTDTVSFTVDGRPVVTANAGEDVQIEEGNSVTLQGGGATNTGGELTYAWKQLSGPEVTLSDASSASPGFSVPELLSDSAIEFELTVSDGTTSSTDTVVVNIAADNDAPIVEAGEGSVVQVGDVVTITGSGSDPEGESLSYAWEQLSGPEVTLEQADTASPQFTVPDLPSVEQVVFQLTVSDGVNSSTDTVSFTVDIQPNLTFSGDDIVIEGNGNIANYTFNLDSAVLHDVTFEWELNGQAQTPVTIVAGESQVTVQIALDANANQQAQLFEVLITNITGAQLDSSQGEVMTALIENNNYESITGTDNRETLRGSDEDDLIEGLAGNDLLRGDDGNDALFGGAGDDTLKGGDDDDQLFGGVGNDELEGDDGNDILFGGAGNDKLEGDKGNDQLFGGAGNDELEGDDGNDILFGGAGNDELEGDRGNDILYGEAGDDSLDGNDGDDQLFGGEGDDILKGGDGDDTLSGGEGDDIFIDTKGRMFLLVAQVMIPST